jgi:hypothetical protein
MAIKPRKMSEEHIVMAVLLSRFLRCCSAILRLPENEFVVIREDGFVAA